VLIEWEKTNSGKWKIKNKVNYNSPEYRRALRLSMKKINPFCEECKTTYNLADPCIHHLSDSEEHKARYNELRKKQLESINKEEEKKTSQTLILNREGD
jgi:hypothetical protein